jgi:flagellar hook-associated protein 1 FlgK
MSLTASMNNAISGLSTATRYASMVSSNISNALTEGYARRDINLTSRVGTSGGVRIEGISRQTNPTVTADRRHAGSDLAFFQAQETVMNAITRAFGRDADEGISKAINDLNSALVTATGDPSNHARQSDVLSSLEGLVQTINTAAKDILAQRQEADTQIGDHVKTLREGLDQIDKLNRKISTAQANGYDANALMDRRDQEIDKIADIIPLRILPRDNGQVALYSQKGLPLLDGNPVEIAFTPTYGIGAHHDVEQGTLSGLTVNGVEVNLASNGPLGQGALAAAFAARDEVAPNALADLDAFTADLVTRFQDTTTDPSLTNGIGIFTDKGDVFDPADSLGLSSRLSLNDDLKDPANLWKLQAGLGATTATTAADSTQFQRLQNALTGELFDKASLASKAGELQSSQNGALQDTSSKAGFYAGVKSEFTEQEAALGVDTDQEMQRLLQIENYYAANAKVIETLDEMMATLMGI